MHETMAEVGKQWAYVITPLVYLEEHLGVPFPDTGPWGDCKTKADLVNGVVSYLKEVAPEKAVRDEISCMYDRALIEAGISLPSSDSSPLW
jgi:hypothetical protein